MPDGEGPSSGQYDFLFEVLKRYDHYAATINFKVALLVSFLGAVIFAISARVAISPISFPDSSCLTGAAYFVVASTIVTALIAIAGLVRVVAPDTRSDISGKSLIFFGDVASTFDGADGYWDAISRASKCDLLKDIANQTYFMAHLLKRKLERLRRVTTFVCYCVVPLMGGSLLVILAESINE